MLNLAVRACCVLAPDPHDITQLVNILETLIVHFKASENSGWSAMDWLHEHFGPWGAMLPQILVPVFAVYIPSSLSRLQ